LLLAVCALAFLYRSEAFAGAETEREPWLDWNLGDRWTFSLPVEGSVGLGYLNGLNTRSIAGGIFDLAIKIAPRLRYRRSFSTTLRVDYAGRETIAAWLPERHIKGGVDVMVRPVSRLRLGLETDAGLVTRPDWPDQYQPQFDESGNPTGVLLPTDRYSFWHVGGIGFVRGSVRKRMHLEGYAGGYLRNYVEDPNYDGLQEPNHLVPADKYWLRGGAKFSGRAWHRRWRYLINARVDWIRYLKTYSRDAGTGETHAGPGGLPANPLQEFVRLRIRLRNSLRSLPLDSKITLRAGYERNQDLFAGYYTWNQAEWSVSIQANPWDWLSIVVRYEGRYRRYTQDGYQEGPDHPPLSEGVGVRMSQAHAVTGRLAFSIFRSRLQVFMEAAWRKNWTNFPDYEPYVFPASYAYSIDWSYSNASCTSGIAFKL